MEVKREVLNTERPISPHFPEDVIFEMRLALGLSQGNFATEHFGSDGTESRRWTIYQKPQVGKKLRLSYPRENLSLGFRDVIVRRIFTVIDSADVTGSKSKTFVQIEDGTTFICNALEN